jgi:hypothetical protein
LIFESPTLIRWDSPFGVLPEKNRMHFEWLSQPNNPLELTAHSAGFRGHS